MIGGTTCPDSICNYNFTKQEKLQMAQALYDKLLDPAIIPMEHHAQHNILKQYAMFHDGYKALFAMIKDCIPH